jgi:TRAP-type C4-dicarboxylate transport system substrate-binding protein
MQKIIILLCSCLLFSSCANAKTYKVATISPDGLGWMKQFRAGVKQVQELTDGRVKFRIYAAGTMGDDATVLRKMRIGQLHGGVVAAGSLTRFYKDLQVYNLPLTFKSLEEVDYIRERMDDRIVDGLRSGGMDSFHLTETGFAYLLSTKPVRTVEDIKKLKAWVPDGDPIAAELLKSFGVSPIPLSITDVLPSLQTGIINAVAVPPMVALALQWHNHVEYMLDLPLIYVYSMLAMDSKSMLSMDSDDQALTKGLLNGVFRKVDSETRIDNEKALSALKLQGIKIIQPEQMDAWEAIARKSIEDLVKSGGISADIVDTFQQHLIDFRSSSAE